MQLSMVWNRVRVPDPNGTCSPDNLQIPHPHSREGIEALESAVQTRLQPYLLYQNYIDENTKNVSFFFLSSKKEISD